MYPASFEYRRPSTIEEALTLLTRHGDDAKILAGGHSLIPAMKLRLAQPKVVIDIGRIGNLSYIREAGGVIAIGAMTSHRDVVLSNLLQDRCPLLPETAAAIGDVQVRNKGTIGGSLAHADPAADYSAAIFALDAEMQAVGPRGERMITADGFFVDLLQTALAPDEILLEVRVRVTPKSVAYVKTEQKASGFALAGVAAVISPRGVRIGITGVARAPYRARAAEDVLMGDGSVTPDAIARASAHAADGVEPLGDIHASPDYRAHLARVNTRRALELAAQRGE
ncbi:MAG: FAD binding domain-containing protein [Vicinamibacterales bacterium]